MATQIIRALVALLAIAALGACGSIQKAVHDMTAPKQEQAVALEQKKEAQAPSSAPAVKPTPSVSVTRTMSVNPESLESLKPFKQFKKGEGEGYAKFYTSRTKAQLVALLRNPALAKKEMRVSCEVLVRQMAEAHGLPFEGCEGAAAEIERNSDYKVVKCDNSMFAADALAVTSKDGKSFGTWHRKCLAGEQVLTYKGKAIVSTMCLNPVIPKVRAAAAQQVATPVTPMCTETPKVRLNIWEAKAIRISGVATAIATTQGVTQGYFGNDRISRGFGAKFRSEHAGGNLMRGNASHEVVMNLLHGNTSTRITKTTVGVGEYYDFPLPDGFREGGVLQFIFRDMTKIVSPVSDLRAAFAEFNLRGCGPRTHLHAIEK